MKRILYSLLALVAFLTFNACEEDPEQDMNLLIGTWQTADAKVKYTFDEYGNCTYEDYRSKVLQPSIVHFLYSYDDTTITLEPIDDKRERTADPIITYTYKFSYDKDGRSCLKLNDLNLYKVK